MIMSTPYPDRPPLNSLGYLDDIFRSMAARSPFALRYLNEEWTDHAVWRNQALTWVKEHLCFNPGPIGLKPTVEKRLEESTYILEKVAFNSSPELRVPAYLLIPKSDRPVPVIILMHDMGSLSLWGKEKMLALPNENPILTSHRQENYEGVSLAHRLVEQGYAVIITDSFTFGERTCPPPGVTLEQLIKERDTYSAAEVEAYMRQLGSQRELAQRHLLLVGATWAGVTAWDDIRTVDYLFTRPEIDTDRIGCMGLSLGGFRTNLLLALDERVKVGVSVGWMTTFASLIGYNVRGAVGYFSQVPGMYNQMDLPDFMALCIPRALQVMLGRQDPLFQPSGMHAAVNTIAAAYEKAGCPEKFRAVMGDHPHEFNRAMQEQAISWIERWI
jgi:dienelactone hydrolase